MQLRQAARLEIFGFGLWLSGAPPSRQERLDALRALIGAIVPEEYQLRIEIEALETPTEPGRPRGLPRGGGKRSDCEPGWFRISGKGRMTFLHGKMAIEPLRRAALDVAKSAVVDPRDLSDIEGLRFRGRCSARGRRVDLEQKTGRAVNARIPEIEAPC